MRDHFLLDRETVFLNHGSYGACPREVFDAWQRRQSELEANPVLYLGRRFATVLREAREALGRLIGAGADDLVAVPNATTAVNIVARSIRLAPGDEVLGTDHEYGACEATWRHVCERQGAVYRRVELPLPFDRDAVVGRLMAAAGPRTRLIMASHVTSTTALLLPVAGLCAAARARGILTLIDGAHAPGQMDLDLAAIGADFYAGNCHKWLCAPKSAGFLHARPEHHALLEAPVISWGYVAEQQSGGAGGHTGFDAYTGRTLLERRLQWQGTRELTAFLTVPDAIAFQQAHDWPARRARCHALAIGLLHRVLARNGLRPIACDDDHLQMVPIPVRCDPGEAAAALRRTLFDEHHIEVPVTQHAGQVFVRASVQAYNDEADLHALERALAGLGV